MFLKKDIDSYLYIEIIIKHSNTTESVNCSNSRFLFKKFSLRNKLYVESKKYNELVIVK